MRTLPDDTDLLSLHRLAPARWPLLLESVAGGNARWDLLFATDGSGLRLDADGVTRDLHGGALEGNFLDLLDAGWRGAGPVAHTSDGLPFHGGWALYLGYELAAQVEPVLRLPRAPGPLPVALALRCPAAIARDRDSGRCVLVCEAGAEALLEGIEAELAAARALPPLPAWQAPARVVEDEARRFLEGVERVHEYLRAGDTFQVNLSRKWRAEFERAPEAGALYARLRDKNPAPFAGLLAHEGWALASSSPERLVSVRGRVVETRPIAGTRPRLAGDDDSKRVDELIGHPKERAEHVMLIDLERNDLGRVCTAGSVQVDELMSVASYAHVHHIVSNVRGRLRPGTTPGGTIAAVFPGGTITGCPKVRCMQVIAELENEPRGPYTGSLGYLNHDGSADFNILIRTISLCGDALEFRAGAGIVADSSPERELAESRAKARGMLLALQT